MNNYSNPLDVFSASYANPNPTHFAMVPHIIDHLTYDDIDDEGNIIKKRLSIHAKELYRVIIRIAGEDGACWASRDTLADLCNMSAGSITKAKVELQKNFNELELTPLIIIKECHKSKVVDGEKKNTTIYHTITITDIWKYNGAYMRTKKFFKPEALSPHDSATPALSPHDSAQGGALSSPDTNNNQDNKTHLFIDKQPVGKPTPVCPLPKQPFVSGQAIPKESPTTKAFNFLMKIGFKELPALEIIGLFTAEDIQNASIYVAEQEKKKKAKGEIIENPVGYFRKVLQENWWKKDGFRECST